MCSIKHWEQAVIRTHLSFKFKNIPILPLLLLLSDKTNFDKLVHITPFTSPVAVG